jgi:hypothetical protein
MVNKKNKSNKPNHKLNIIDNKCSVSIITITQLNRFDSLKILLDLINNQTYPNIIEWIIVEGSKLDSDANLNKTNINNMIEEFESESDSKSKSKSESESKSNTNFKIKYVEKKSNMKLGELRNIGNKLCVGDITVCMDDDDYYPPTRIAHAVKKLSESNFKIAGCSDHLMYDYNLKILAKLKVQGKYHSPNSCMAWKKEYLENNSHDSSKDFGEELSFTKNFTEPMIQLEPYSTIILSSHNLNTFSKKCFFVLKANGFDCIIDKIITEPINKFIPDDISNKYDKIFNKNMDLDKISNGYFDYDIVYMCGTFSISWDPSEKKLGGSEQAIVNLSENWVGLGKKVIVYGEVPDITLNGVEYKPWYKFNYNLKYKNLILWRMYGLISVLPFGISADFIAFDAHDNFVNEVQKYYFKYKKYADKIFVKSIYHKECFLECVDSNFDENKIVIIENGVRINNFQIKDNSIQRNPYRFCYCSCYTRGLDKLISKLWPMIYSYEPRAELHVYYGMDNIKDDKYVKYLQFLLSQPGVMDHGRQSVDIIAREKYMSTFQLYLTNSKTEIDCISIKESIITGCIPIITNFGVFKERTGIHLDFNDDNQIKMAGINIINLFINPHKVEFYKNEIIKAKSKILDWDKIACEWTKYFV